MLADTAEQRPGQARVPRLRQTRFDVTLHALVLLEIFSDEIRGFVRTDAELLCKSERSLPIHDAEIDSLRAVPLHWTHLINGQPENGSCRAPVNIFTGRECFSKAFVARQVGQDAQSDL